LSNQKSEDFMNGLNYKAGDGIFYHFYQHAVLGLAHQIPRFNTQENWVEKLGNLGLWTLENFPGKAWRLMKEPRWITIALTKISLAAVTYAFYPKESIAITKAVLLQLPLPSREAVKFGVYLTIVAHIVSLALRAYGRFRNEDLMNAWYGKNQDVKV
jgi:hypothetical protein